MTPNSRLLWAASCLICIATSGLCGTAHAVVNGLPATDPDGLRNFVVRVENSHQEKCSGTLVAPNLVVTAAHCVTSPAKYEIVSLDRHFQAKSTAVAQIAVHPDFEAAATPGRQLGVDLGLLRLAHALGPQYVPLALNRARPIVSGQPTVIAGFGVDEYQNHSLVLRQAPLVLAKLLRIAPNIREFVDANRFGETAGAGACQGDSGAPLVAGEPGRYELLGIVSWSSGPLDNPAASCGGLTAVTPIADEIEWIERELETMHPTALNLSEQHPLSRR